LGQHRTHKLDWGWNPRLRSEILATDSEQQNGDIKKFNNLKLADIGTVSLVESPIPCTKSHVPSTAPLTKSQNNAMTYLLLQKYTKILPREMEQELWH
jgi:hypothetical protein